jgi:DNA-binding transcriptional MerR regulator
MRGDADSASPEVLFTLPELADLSGVDYRTLHNWQKRGMLRPSSREATGSGSTSLFDAADALQVLILAELRLGGIEVSVLQKIASRVHELAASVNGKELLLISDGRVDLHDAADLDSGLSDERPNLVLSISRAREAVEQARAA